MNWDFRGAWRATVHQGGRESDTAEQLILQAVGHPPGWGSQHHVGSGVNPPRPPSQMWLLGPAGPRSASPGKVECGEE